MSLNKAQALTLQCSKAITVRHHWYAVLLLECFCINVLVPRADQPLDIWEAPITLCRSICVTGCKLAFFAEN